MKKRTEAGFTIVEALIAVIVTTIMIMVVTNFMMRSLQTSTMEAKKATILSEIQLTLDNVSNDIRLSANADQNNRIPDQNSPGGSSNPLGWTSNDSTLVLATAATTASHQMIFSDAANYITAKNNLVYFISNGTLYRRTLAANVTGNGAMTTCPAALATDTCPADKEMLHDVTNFQITYLDGNNTIVSPPNARSIQLSLTAQTNSGHETQSASYTTRMVFRND
jgi:type II secretory pathway pseudopilin PulG